MGSSCILIGETAWAGYDANLQHRKATTTDQCIKITFCDDPTSCDPLTYAKLLMLRTGRGAGIARPYICAYIQAPGMGKQDHLLPGSYAQQTSDVHHSDLGDAIYAKMEKSIYRGVGIARPYITTYIRAPGMGKKDHPSLCSPCPVHLFNALL